MTSSNEVPPYPEIPIKRAAPHVHILGTPPSTYDMPYGVWYAANQQILNWHESGSEIKFETCKAYKDIIQLTYSRFSLPSIGRYHIYFKYWMRNPILGNPLPLPYSLLTHEININLNDVSIMRASNVRLDVIPSNEDMETIISVKTLPAVISVTIPWPAHLIIMGLEPTLAGLQPHVSLLISKLS